MPADTSATPPPTMALVPEFWVNVPVPLTPIASKPPTKSGPPGTVGSAH